MSLIEKIIIVLIAVHLATIISFLVLKRISILEKFRSSISHPANQGSTAIQVGGLIVIPITLCAILILLYDLKNIPLFFQLVFCLPVILLFITGFIDDYKPVSAPIRLVIHFANAISITIIIFQITHYAGLERLTSITGFIIPSIFMVLAISWMINTINFIDGMDMFLVINIIPGTLLFSLLHLITNNDLISSVGFWVFLSSLLGFVWFNYPKASVYMGDAGTLCIGFLLGSFSVYILAKYGSISGFIPFAYILVDTTFTLINRLKNGLNPFKSHNQHAYQIAMRNGKSENTIRVYCLFANTVNTLLAYMCFQFHHTIIWQFVFGITAFFVSLTVFFFFRKNSSLGLTETI